jgi:AraC-like DNA-binding protein/mannose-6-phosphate isomerase-like protein (cupin superfamily)
MKPLAHLISLASKLTFEEYQGGQLLDGRGQFQWRPPGDFPLAVMPTCFSDRQYSPPLTWHEYLEVFVPVEGQCQVQVGRSMVELAAGDVLVMDNLKLHALRKFEGRRLRVVVIRFLPELIYSAGSLATDHLFCVPFYHQVEGQPHVLRGTERQAAFVHAALAHLLECYYDSSGPPYSHAGTKVFFLQVLYYLAKRFQVSETLYSEYLLHRDRSHRLRKLFDYTALHYGEKITVSEAAALVGMSRRRFLSVFKTMADMTWVKYLNEVRLTNAARLVKQTTLSIAEIAAQVGYSDQSYMNRRFHQRFGHTPLELRKQALP